MSDELLTCPYCNARQPVPPGLAAGQKATCVRCGDAFLVRDLPASAFTTGPAFANPAGPSFPPPYQKPVAANRLVGAVILVVMGLMAGTGLTYALLTVDKRREHDRAMPRKVRKPWLTPTLPVDPGEPTPPGQLPALGYLPPSTGVVAGLHFEDLLASETGKQWRARNVGAGRWAFSLDSVREWTGIDAENVDHLVAGVVVRDGKERDLTPPVHVVVRTRKPYDASRVRVALKAGKSATEKTPEGGRRTVYSGAVRDLPAQLWLADDTTLVVGLLVSSLEQVPGKPAEDLSALPEELRRVIEERLTSGVPAWVAGHSADWQKTLLPFALAAAKDVPVVERIADVRTFALWAVPGTPPRLAGAFQCKDEETARRIEESDLAGRQKANPERFKYTRAGAWLDVQMKLRGAGGQQD